MVAYEPGSYTLTQNEIGPRYVQIGLRTFMDPSDPADREEGHKLQDEIKVIQASPGKFEVPDWDQRQRLHDAMVALGPFTSDSRRVFGDKGGWIQYGMLWELRMRWGGNRE